MCLLIENVSQVSNIAHMPLVSIMNFIDKIGNPNVIKLNAPL